MVVAIVVSLVVIGNRKGRKDVVLFVVFIEKLKRNFNFSACKETWNELS